MNEILHVLTDPAHWVAEVVMDGTLTLLAVLPLRALVRRHDRKRHPKVPSDKGVLTAADFGTLRYAAWALDEIGDSHDKACAARLRDIDSRLVNES